VERVSDRGGEAVDWGEPRHKTVTFYDPAVTAGGIATRTGLAFLRAMRDGELPSPPIVALLGMRLAEIEPGLVVFECQPDESVYNPTGLVHGGLVSTMADSAAGCAVHSTLDAGVGFTSIDLTVSFLRPVTVESGLLRATGRVTKPGRRVAFAAVEIVDGAGRLVASATSSILILGPRPA
jgi:uncharacterized protein (TIGR00369 family)